MGFPKLAEIKANMDVPAASSPAATTEAPVSSTPAAEPTSTAEAPQAEAPKTESPAATEPAPTTEQSIPYDRFKEVNEARKEASAQNEALQQRLAELEARISAQPEETAKEEKAPDPNPLMEKIEAYVAENEHDESAQIIKDLAAQLQAAQQTANQAATSAHNQEVQRLVREFQSRIDTALNEVKVSDADAARVFMLTRLDQDARADMKAAAAEYAKLERDYEDKILARLGMQRPGEKTEPEADPTDVLPDRPAGGGSTAKPVTSQITPPDAGTTLRDLRKKLGRNRRR